MVQNPKGPNLTVESHEFSCGYGPRAIRLSYDRKTLFVGCKDGSVTRLDLKTAQQGGEGAAVLVCGPREAGVRSLCEVGGGWLLLGEDGGSLHKLRSQGPADELVDLTGLLPPRCGTVGYVGRWDSNLFLVSPRSADAILLEVQTDGTHRKDRELPGVRAMSGFARVGEDERWIVGKTGALWAWRSGGIENLDGAWDRVGLGRPSFVFDLAVVRDPDDLYDKGIYLSTDQGVFLLHLVSDPPRLALDPVYLTGVTDLCLAVAHAVQGPFRFLWVSDTEGKLHLFWSAREVTSGRQHWHRAGHLERSFPVMRALATWYLEDVEAVVAQACRDDRIIISSYRRFEAQDSEARREGRDLSEVLSWGEIDRIRGALLAEDPRRKWSTEALVADLIEDPTELAGAEDEPLRRFLRNPGIGLAISALEEILEDASPRRAGEAVTLWTHTLLGTVHRRLGSPSIQDYLGILRWLRSIESSPELADLLVKHPAAAQTLRASIDQNIQYARKWGVFGRTYTERENILPALVAFGKQQTFDRRFDRLVYESLVFRRQMDLQEVLPDPVGKKLKLRPWGLEHLAIQEEEGLTEYMALSWDEGGTVYQRTTGARHWRELPVPRTGTEPVPGRARALGRRILLGTCGAGGQVQPYLISTPAPEKRDPASPKRPHEILLHFLSPAITEAPGGRLPVADLLKNADSEAVYSLLALGSGRVAVGLRGTDRSARFGLLRITGDGRLRALHLKGELPQFRAIYPESKMQLGNPVWRLAAHSPSEEETFLFLGCDDGQIWKAHIHFVGENGYRVDVPVLVGRLSTRVSAVACRAVQGAGGAPLLRVFAGGADGTLVAFQALANRRTENQEEETQKEEYATLWATFEQGPVQSLHLLASKLAAGKAEDRESNVRQLVLAVTERGIVVPILDRAEVERLDDPPGIEPRLHRLKLPGERLGRFSIGSSVLGSALVTGLAVAADDTSPVLARLAVAPAAGAPRIVHLCYPKYTQLRRAFFAKLVRDWLASLCEGGPEIQGWLLRRPETTFVVAPELAASLVRWILPSEPERDAAEGEDSEAGEDWSTWTERQSKDPDARRRDVKQWLPRHLRPLVGLAEAWRKKDRLEGLFKAALLAAREIEDRALFREILETVLSRANHQLFREARRGESGFGSQFRDLVEDLKEVKGVWAGSAGNLDMRMRITVAKSLLDGDTLWSLSGALDAASPAGDNPLAQAMKSRIELIHRFLGEGDLLLAIETLRAANLALLRACRRLERSGDPAHWSRQPGVSQLRWDSISGFFKGVGDFAARVAHPKGTLGEVAAHEICRAFALGMLACPSAIVRLSLWIAEADLPIDIGRRVGKQLDVLAALLGKDFPPLSDDHRKLLRITLHEPQPGEDYKSVLFFRPEPHAPQVPYWESQPHRFGEDNVEMTRSREPLDRILHWLHDLARQLTEDAGGVEISKVGELRRALAPVPDEDKHQFRHSRRLWREALSDLAALSKGFDLPAAGNGNGGGAAFGLRHVRPDLVLFSASLAGWCRRLRLHLQELRQQYQIFEPMASLCDHALALVERAAERFQRGAAVQKNLVLGVMGHGLLEHLDEHLLEVWEVALALDPRRTWDQDVEATERAVRPESAAPSTAGRFADYLLQRAYRAEMIPKNLRSLQGLLSFPEHSEAPPVPLSDLLAEFNHHWGWELDSVACEENLDHRTYHFLHLTLSELAQNDRVHGRGQGKPAVRRGGARPPDAPRLELQFSYPREDGSAFKRIQELADGRLQVMIERCDDPAIPSHGSGLYLANLAAAAVGWKLDLRKPDEPGRMVFELWQTGGAR